MLQVRMTNIQRASRLQPSAMGSWSTAAHCAFEDWLSKPWGAKSPATCKSSLTTSLPSLMSAENHNIQRPSSSDTRISTVQPRLPSSPTSSSSSSSPPKTLKNLRNPDVKSIGLVVHPKLVSVQGLRCQMPLLAEPKTMWKKRDTV